MVGRNIFRGRTESGCKIGREVHRCAKPRRENKGAAVNKGFEIVPVIRFQSNSRGGGEEILDRGGAELQLVVPRWLESISFER
jgi:hypothetical protein